MDGTTSSLGVFDLGTFLATTLVAAVVAGAAGFAFGLIAAAGWLQVLTPIQTATLIVGYGLAVQGMAVWKLRRALSWRLLWPFLLGAAAGVPLGTALLAVVDPSAMRRAIGVVLILYGLYALVRPTLKPVGAVGWPADCGIGFCNGILGGTTGLAGIIVVIWAGLRGWPKDVQRAVFQPVAVATFALSALWLGARGSVGADTFWLLLVGLPLLVAGTWLGLKLYSRLDETRFRRIVLVLLLVSGMSLIFQP